MSLWQVRQTIYFNLDTLTQCLNLEITNKLLWCCLFELGSRNLLLVVSEKPDCPAFRITWLWMRYLNSKPTLCFCLDQTRLHYTHFCPRKVALKGVRVAFLGLTVSKQFRNKGSTLNRLEANRLCEHFLL